MIYSKELTLSDDAIEQTVSELTEVYLKTAKKKAISATKIRISFEELILSFRDCYGENTLCRLSLTRLFGKLTFEMETGGERKDWQPCEEDMTLPFNILSKLNIYPKYRYSLIGKGRNNVSWQVPTTARNNKLLYSMLISILLAVVASVIMKLLPEQTGNLIVNDVITPVFNKFIAILSELATPLVFLSVICGIIDIGDVKLFGNIGYKMLTRMLGSYLIAGIFLAGGCVIAYGVTLTSGGSSTSGAVGQILNMVLDIIPGNLIQPFSADNDLQVIVISVMVGVTMLILGSAVAGLKTIVKEASDLINKMMLICCKFIPVVIFFGVVKLIMTSSYTQFLGIAKMFLVYIGSNLCFEICMYIRAWIVTKAKPATLLPKQLATLMINVATASQVAALPENMKCCKDKFGIDKKLVDFGLPLGIVIYMPSGAIFLGLSAWALCVASGTPVSIGVAIKIVIVAIILAISAPPIPGSAIVVTPVLFASCGIPNDMFPLAIIFATIVGYVLPAFNGLNIQLEMLMTAKKLKKVDEEKLSAAYKE